jgi:hypothetical protein
MACGLSSLIPFLIVSSASSPQTDRKVAPPTQTEREATNAVIKKMAVLVRDKDQEIAKHLDAFREGTIPTFPEGISFTVGRHAAVYLGSNSVARGPILALYAKREGTKVSLAMFDVVPDDEAESASNDQYLAARELGTADKKSSLHQFLVANIPKLNFQETMIKDGELLCPSSMAPPALVRQNGKALYLVRATLMEHPKVFLTYMTVPTAQ